MKWLFLLLTIGLHAQAQKLDVSDQNGCVIRDSDVRCWGAGIHSEPKKIGLRLNHPIQVVASSTSACVLDQGPSGNEVKCWNHKELLSIHPSIQLRNPKKLSGAGDKVLDDDGVKRLELLDASKMKHLDLYTYHADTRFLHFKNPFDVSGDCVLYDGGVGCMQYSYETSKYDLEFIRHLQNPTDIDIRYTNICVKDDLGVSCSDGRVRPPPGLIDATSLTVGYDRACVIHNNRVRCWSRGYYNEFNPQHLDPIENISHPKEVRADDLDTYVLDADGLKAWGESWTYQKWAQNLKNPKKIISSGARICAIDDTGLNCDWIGLERDDSDFRYKYTGYGLDTSSITQYDFGIFECWKDKKGVDCTLYGGEIKNTIPEGHTRIPKGLKNPSYLAVGASHACAIENSKPYCWGSNENGQRDIPKDIKQVSEMAVGWTHTCAITKKGVRCWGENSYGQLDVPPDLKNPKMLTTGYRTCVLDDLKVRCWGKSPDGIDYNGTKKIIETPHPVLKNPRALFTGLADFDGVDGEYQCVFDEDVPVKCWGRADFVRWIPRIQKYLKHPIDMIIRNDFICILDGLENTEVKCFAGAHEREDKLKSKLDFLDLQNDPQWNWHRLGGREFSLNALEDRLLQMSKPLPVLQSWLLKNLSAFIDAKLKNCFISSFDMKTRPECRPLFNNPRSNSVLAARLLTLKLLEPVMTSIKTENFKQQLWPAYEQAVVSSENFLQQNGIRFEAVAATPLEKAATLKILELSLRAAVKAVGANQTQPVLDLAKLAAKAGLSASKTDVDQILSRQSTITAQLATIRGAPKAAFLADTIELSLAWLGSNP